MGSGVIEGPPGAPGAGAGGGGACASLRIGEVAIEAGVTTRTLRYYQELGLLDPGQSPGGSRRYGESDVIRLKRILELRDVMGFDLERIRAILSSEDRLAELRARGPAGRVGPAPAGDPGRSHGYQPRHAGAGPGQAGRP